MPRAQAAPFPALAGGTEDSPKFKLLIAVVNLRCMSGGPCNEHIVFPQKPFVNARTHVLGKVYGSFKTLVGTFLRKLRFLVIILQSFEISRQGELVRPRCQS